MELKAQHSMKDILGTAAAQNKTLELALSGGQKYTGIVSEVGDHHVVLKELVGKEFYDALIAIAQVVAIEVRAR